MTSKISSFVVGLILFSGVSSAWAAETVHEAVHEFWAGEGEMTTTEGDVSECGVIRIAIDRSENHITFPEFLNCSILSQFPDFTFDIDGTRILLNGKEVGEILESQMTLEVPDPLGGFTELLELKWKDGKLFYRSTVYLGHGGDFMIVQGILDRE